MKWDGIFINAVGTYVPGPVRVGNMAENIDHEESDDDYAYYESITVADIPGYAMAGIAATRAMKRSDHCDEALSTIVYASASGNTDHVTPVCHIQRILQQEEALAFELSAASNGGLTGIEAVARMLSNGQSPGPGLVVTSMSLPSGMLRSHREHFGGVVLGDGAAAALISKKSGFAKIIASQRISISDFEVLSRNRSSAPGVWDIPYLEVELGQYAETLAQEAEAMIHATLAEVNMSIDDISYFCLQALPIPAVQLLYLERNKIPIEKTCWSELRKYGHVGPCDELLGIAHLVETGQLKSGQFVLLAGGGMGFRFSSLLLQIV